MTVEEKARLDQVVNAAVLRIGNLESDELYSKIVREACLAAIEAEREDCARMVAEKGKGLMDCSIEYRAMGHTLAANAESIAAAALELLAEQIRARSANPP